MKRDQNRPKVVAVASGGGHWEQMVLLSEAFADADTTFVTTLDGLGERAGLKNVRVVPDCNRNQPIQAARCAVALLMLLLRIRPDVLISTGALPGVIAMVIARRLGARTVWVDSIANAEEPSMAGRKAKSHAVLWLSQWPDVAAHEGGRYAGSVL